MADHDEFLTPDVRFHLIRRMEQHRVIALGETQLLVHERKYLEFHQVSGIILFERNVHSLSQVGELIASVTEVLSEDAGLPPLVMADHEGDFVAELKRIIGMPPSALAIAATGDLDLAHDVAKETGLAMKKLGVSVVLSPVADCCLDLASPITGLRTFGADPDRVADFVVQTIAGFRAAGVLTCAKHFPGHGSTPEDSHETLPEVGKSLEALRNDDLIPFDRAIQNDVDMIMMSHVAFPMGRDEIVPASFDAALTRELLRDEMGYDGVVITDALEMAGATWYAQGVAGGFAGGFERTLLAGSDLMLHTRPIPENMPAGQNDKPVPSINVMDAIIKTLENVVDSKRIDEKLAEAAESNEALRKLLSLLDKSGERIAAARRRVVAPSRSRPSRPASNVIEFDAYPSVPGVYRKVAQASITALGETDYPLPDAKRYTVMPVEWSRGEMLKGQDLSAFLDVLCKNFPSWDRMGQVSGFSTSEDGDVVPVFRDKPAVVDAARAGAGAAGMDNFEMPADVELIMVLSMRGIPGEDFMGALQTFAERYDPSVVLLTGWPVTDWIPEGCRVLVCLGASPQVASAVADVLSGAAEAPGNIDGLLPRGGQRPAL